jgi:antitoxin component YwqK of YwqJK toxin-antitoxin module
MERPQLKKEDILKVEGYNTPQNSIPHGKARTYYPNGILKDEVVFVNGIQNGIRKYYYPSGRIWVEQELKNGNPWTVIANYTENGEKRNPGSLKNGNGTVFLYGEDGKVREVVKYKNGIIIE